MLLVGLMVACLLLTTIPPATSGLSGSLEIRGDDSLRRMAVENGWPGSGTSADPYVLIDNATTASGSIGFLIRDVSLHLDLINCSVDQSQTAFYIYNSKNIRLIDCAATRSGTGFEVMSSEDIVMDNVTTFECGVGISLSESVSVEVANSDLSNGTVGMRAWSSVVLKVSGSNISRNEVGLELASSSLALVYRNNFTECSQKAVLLTAAGNNEVVENNVSSCGKGVSVELTSHDNIVQGNEFLNITDEGIGVVASRSTVIEANTFSSIGAHGISLKDSTDNVLDSNTMSGCSIFLDGDLKTFSTQTIEETNLVDGLPVRYVKNAVGGSLNGTWGEVIIGNVTGMEVSVTVHAGSVALCVGHSLGLNITETDLSSRLVGGSLLYVHSSVVRVSEFHDSAQGLAINDCHELVVRQCKFHHNAQGVGLLGGHMVEVLSNLFHNNSAMGVWVQASTQFMIDSNIIRDERVGVELYQAASGMVNSNTINRSNIGICLNMTSGVVASCNVITSCQEGILLSSSSQCVVSYALLTSNHIGVHLLSTSETIVEECESVTNRKAVLIEASDSNAVLNNVFLNDDCAIELNGTTTTVIEGNELTGCFNGITATGSLNDTISNNRAEHCDRAIYLDTCAEMRLLLNRLGNNTQGIHLLDVVLSEVEGNSLFYNEFGAVLFGSRGIVLESNLGCYNDHAFALEGSDLNFLLNNTLSFGLDYGIGLRASSFNLITGNTLDRNEGPGIRICSGSGNMIWNNVFLSNNDASLWHGSRVQAIDEGTDNMWNTEGLLHNFGNHWSDWTSPDVDCGGIVDAPYVSGRILDEYPLVVPYVEPPSAPLGLVTVAGNASVQLTWTAPVNNGGAAIINYLVYREVNGTVDQPVVLGTENSYVDFNVTNGLNYTYWVVAANLMGPGPASVNSTARPASVPFAPTELMAEANISQGNILLNWNAPDNGGAEVYEYRLYRGPDAGNLSLLAALTVPSYNDTAAVRGTQYCYAVSAVNVMGEGLLSVIINATVPALPPTSPINVTAVASDSLVAVQWEAPEWNGGSNITFYLVYRGASPDSGAIVANTTDLRHEDGAVLNGKTYYYWVVAVNGVGEGNVSMVVSARPATLPGVVGDIVATISNSMVILTWSEPDSDGGADIFDYYIYRSLTPSGGELVGTSEGGLTYTDFVATAGFSYYYRIVAVNPVGEGEPSLFVKAKSTKTLAGKVLDGNDEPVPNAMVIIDGVEYFTNEDGIFVAEVLPGEKTITIRAPGMQELVKKMNVTIRSRDLGTFQMAPGGSSGMSMDMLPIMVIAVVGLVAVLLVFSRVVRRGGDKGERKGRRRKKAP